MTCNDCGRDINYCDRYGCREVNGVAWAERLLPAKQEATRIGKRLTELPARETPGEPK